MIDKIISSERKFQLWLYSASHKQLLLRSNKSLEHHTRIDVLFKMVEMINIKTSISGLTITRMDESDFGSTQYHGLLNQGNLLFKVTSESSEGYILAAECFSIEDELEYYDPSKLLPGVTN